MMKLFLIPLLPLLLSCCANAQAINFSIPINEEDIRGKNIIGYYDQGNSQVIIDTQKKDSITHHFYNDSFVLQKEYTVLDDDRRLLYAMYGPGHRKTYFQKNFSIQKTSFEVYDSGDSMVIYRLDRENAADTKMTGIDFNKNYKDAKLVAIMPGDHGCSFLSVSLKKELLFIYKWNAKTNQVTMLQAMLPGSTLSKEEIKQSYGTYLEISYKYLFYNLSVSDMRKTDIFQFPGLSQLFYNDTCIAIVHKIPNEMGINVFKINATNGIINSKNYFINKPPSQTKLNDIAYPVATIYDSLLVIQNWSPNKIAYLFFNFNTEQLITKQQANTSDSLYLLVHSALRQVGTFGSESGEKEVNNERLFIKRMSHGMMFIKPIVARDSLILSFGSFVPTQGVEGLLLNTASISTGMYVSSFTNSTYIPYYMNERNKFLYAHSKFSLDALKPSQAKNIKTYLDDFIADKKMKEVNDDNSILIASTDKIYIGIYKRPGRTLDVSVYQGH